MVSRTPSFNAARQRPLTVSGKKKGVRKLTRHHILAGFLVIGASVVVLQVSFVHRMISSQQQQQQHEPTGRRHLPETPSVRHHVDRAASRVFVSHKDYDDLSLEERLGINVTLLENIRAEPIPEKRSADGRLLFNPEEFRTGDRGAYLNRPLPCPDCRDKADRLMQQPVPDAVDLRYRPAAVKGKYVVVSVNHLLSNMNKRELTWFVGSLRNTGYDGHIIMGTHPEIARDVEKMLVDWDVTIYNVREVNCQGSVGRYKDKRGRPIKCFDALPNVPTELGRYELARRWLHACNDCTGRVLLEFDSKVSFFQSNPFTSASPDLSQSDLVLSEELAPHTDPYYGSSEYPDRHLSISSSGNYRGATEGCYPKNHQAEFGEHRPVLVARSAFGTRQGLHRYLSVLADEFNNNLDKQACHFPKLDDVWTMNYLYYTGRFGGSSEQSVVTMPFGYGYTMSVGRPCFNQYKKPNHSHLDIVQLDFDRTGYIVNNYRADQDAPLHIVPVVRQITECEKWIKMFIKHHGEINGNTHVETKDKDYLDIFQHSILQSIKKLPPASKEHPMETSYQRATVVQQAPWFPHQKYCTETCCAQAIAISLDQDAEHLITSVDGMDLADVALLGHSKKTYLDWAISDLTNDIIPCLRAGTIIYADHEGGGFKRFIDYYRSKLTKPYLLITGGTDGIEPWGPGNLGRKVLQEDELLINWYGINPSYNHGANLPKFQLMFLGLSAGFDHQKHLSAYQHAMNYTNPFAGENKKRFTESLDLKAATDTSHLLFVKFGINEHSKHRQEPFDMACNNRTDHPMDDISCSHSKRKYHSSEIYDAARHYLFGLSPPGNGKDCYRTYELLYLGIIPVVQYNREYADLYEGLPLLQLDHWRYTQQELVQKMRDYIESPEFRDNDFPGWNKLFLNYWRRRVLEDTGRLPEIVTDDQGRKYYTSWTYTRYTKPYTKSFWPPKEPMEQLEHML